MKDEAQEGVQILAEEEKEKENSLGSFRIEDHP